MRRGSRFTNLAGRNQTPHAGPGGYSKQTTQRGLFADGVWHCDCEPRLPAEHFRVKKEGRNQGRWFYTCQQAEPRRCPFFLWDEDARPREEAAVLNNSRTEPERGPGAKPARDGKATTDNGGQGVGRGLFAGASRGRDRSDSSTASPSPEPIRRSSTGSKRVAGLAGLPESEDDEEFFPWPATADEEQESAGTLRSGSLETPRKAQKTGVYATPATSKINRRLSWVEHTPPAPRTPTTEAAEGPIVTPSKPPTSAAGHPTTLDNRPTTPHAPPTRATATSPSPPPRHRDAFINPDDSTSSLAGQVLAVLAPAGKAPLLAPDVLTGVRAILSRHDLRTQGIVKGRDISRLALRAKDVRIAELLARIAGLEAEREADRAVIRSLRGGQGGDGKA